MGRGDGMMPSLGRFTYMDNIRRTFPRNGERILRSLAWALTLTGLIVDASLAQSSTGSVNGVASVPSGLAISGASVWLGSLGRWGKRTTIPNSAGLVESSRIEHGFSVSGACAERA